MKKFLGVLVIVASIAAGIFMVFTGKYVAWTGIISAEFPKFWLGVGDTLLGYVVLIGGSMIGTAIYELGNVNKALKEDGLKGAMDYIKSINK